MRITKLYPPKNNSFVCDLPIKSQTLFGALANCWVELFGESEFYEFINLFESGVVSSVFPAVKINEKEIFFLPKPFLSKKKIKGNDEQQVSKKKIKKIRWISVEAMKHLAKSISTESDDFYHSVDFLSKFKIIGKEFLILPSELDDKLISKLSNFSFYTKGTNIRVNVSRFGDDSLPFDQSELTFSYFTNEKLELQTFLYYFENFAENTKVEATKNLLIDNGVGGKRNLGKGYFDRFETEEVDFVFDPVSPFLLISTMIPLKEELTSIKYYETDVDDGFITFGSAKTVRKDRIFLIKEGAILTKEVEGKIIKQEYSDKFIYRYGKAFLLPLGGFNE